MAIEIFEANIKDIKPYENNPRVIPAEAVERVANSIKEFGMKVPIVVDRDMVIVTGHTRLKACESLRMGTVPCIMADDLTPEQIKAFRLADNKTNEFTSWDENLLGLELGELDSVFDMSQFGFECDFGGSDEDTLGGGQSLVDSFIVPPFSIIDTRQGYWQERKNRWKTLIHSQEGRASALLGRGLKELGEKYCGGSEATLGTSIFDPVLAEILIKWFCPASGKIIDCFAGGSVRGLVSTFLGREYIGVDLSERQIEANEENFRSVEHITDAEGEPLARPTWICGDSSRIDDIVQEDNFDFLLTCPPYGDLEVYSDKPEDISNMPYEQFRDVYMEIIRKTCAKLKENAFAAIVVGDIRDKKGFYRDFIGDTKQAFKNAGLNLYNDCVLVEQIATARVRARRQFDAGRKVVKTHQNVLIFIKGDVKKIIPSLQDLSEEIENALKEFDEGEQND